MVIRTPFNTCVLLAAFILLSIAFSSTWFSREQFSAAPGHNEDFAQPVEHADIRPDDAELASYESPAADIEHFEQPEPEHERKWLIATMVAAHSIQRRAIIRSTWQKLYKDESLFTTRFVLSNPGEQWADVIAAENATYGDIIVLSHLEENAYVANHVKTIEFLKMLVQQGNPWRFVSKIDDDSYLEPFAFWKQFLEPLYAGSATRTIVARYLNWPEGNFKFPGGQFYTLTWDTIELVMSLYEANPLKDEFEDVLIGRLLHEASEPWELIVLENPIAFDYDDKFGATVDGVETAWAKEGSDPNAWVHGVGPGAINPHKMKTDEAYLRVAACYGPDGLLNITEASGIPWY